MRGPVMTLGRVATWVLGAGLALAAGCGVSRETIPSESGPERSPSEPAAADAEAARGGAANIGELPSTFVLKGAQLWGIGPSDLVVENGRIKSLGPAPEGAFSIDVEGRFIVAAAIDSHVHLAYYPVADSLASAGIAAAIDLAAPLENLSTRYPIEVIQSGPMITAVDGYPTQSWGSNGYGLEVSSASAAKAAVADLAKAGARVIKVPLTTGPTLDDAMLEAVVKEAHARGLKVAAHALEGSAYERAAKAGVDALAHTPVEALTDDQAKLWGKRAVISTLSAFSSAAAIENLRRLRAQGAVVLYGTDLGNTRTAGVQGDEIERLKSAGLDATDIIESMTEAPARYWELEILGSLEVGKAASFMLLDRDPKQHPSALTNPVEVYLNGVRLR
jgi:imidazolonepropionase-like amidohydrolase